VCSGRVVEDEAGRVVLEQRGVAVLRAELFALSELKGLRVFVDRDDVGVTREEHAAVGHAPHRLVRAQRAWKVGNGSS